MSKHTKGPWYWSDKFLTSDGQETWSLVGVDGFGILSCDGKCNSPQEVNANDARLIAAAPDLLEALQAAVTCGMVPSSTAADGGANKHSEWVRVADHIRAAINKATGE